MYEIPVTSLTSDGARQNRFYRLCQDHGKGKLPYKCTNSYHKDKELFFFCDVPHLLKTARNCFSNSFSHSKSRKMQVCCQWIMHEYVNPPKCSFIRKRDSLLAGSLLKASTWLRPLPQPLALGFVTSWQGITSGSHRTHVWGCIWQLKWVN